MQITPLIRDIPCQQKLFGFFLTDCLNQGGNTQKVPLYFSISRTQNTLPFHITT